MSATKIGYDFFCAPAAPFFGPQSVSFARPLVNRNFAGFVLAVLALCAFNPIETQAIQINFSFTDSFGTGGTVTGQFLGLTDDATGPASSVVLTSYPPEFDPSFLLQPPAAPYLFGAPDHNSFTLANGALLHAQFYVESPPIFSLPTPPSPPGFPGETYTAVATTRWFSFDAQVPIGGLRAGVLSVLYEAVGVFDRERGGFSLEWFEISNSFTEGLVLTNSAANVSFTVIGAEIPEPTSLVMFGSGLVGLVGYRWRRMRK